MKGTGKKVGAQKKGEKRQGVIKWEGSECRGGKASGDMEERGRSRGGEGYRGKGIQELAPNHPLNSAILQPKIV